MLKPKSTLHKRMLKIAKVLFDMIFVFAFFFILFHVLEIVLLKQSHLQLYVAATYYTSIIQKWMLRLTILSFETLITFLVIWLVILLITLPFKYANIKNKSLTTLIKNRKLESETKL
mgnify:CR=1 FL=1